MALELPGSVQVVVGLEVHVQLLTRTKIFCGCPNEFAPDRPNTAVCPVCLGLPGALPVLNEEAVRLAVLAGLGMRCQIAHYTKWDRKQYHYPDLPKGYQTSQYDLPVVGRGVFVFDGPEGRTEARIRRAHLEEDAGKNIHAGRESRVDLNRAGTPLLEIVTEPDLRSGADAKAMLQELRLLLRYLGVSDCNMQEGSLRCDANVNLQLTGRADETATPIVEIKNLNSFRSVEAAVEYEAKRQYDEFQKTGETIETGTKQTRGFDADRGRTIPQREKEAEADYRYFPCPDLLPVTLDEAAIAAIEDEVPERPAERRRRFISDLRLSEYDAGVLVEAGRGVSDYFEETAEAVVEETGDAKPAANWVSQEVLRDLKGREIDQFPVPAAILGDLILRVEKRELASKAAREVFAALLEQGEADEKLTKKSIDRIIDDRGLAAVGGGAQLDAAIEAALEQHEKAVQDVKRGNDKAAGPIIGTVMKNVKGADPKSVREAILAAIAAKPRR